jgi:hypothetical protein
MFGKVMTLLYTPYTTVGITSCVLFIVLELKGTGPFGFSVFFYTSL